MFSVASFNLIHLSLMVIENHRLFQVKDTTRSMRYPVFEKSIYQMNWIADGSDDVSAEDGAKTEKEPEKGKKAKPKEKKKKRKWLILSNEKSSVSKAVTEAFDVLQEDPEDISFLEASVTDMVKDFKDKLSKHIESMECEDKELIVVNLLPTIAHSIGLDIDIAFSAHWLCFESSLETLKILSDNEMKLSSSKLLVVTYQSVGYDVLERHNCSIPWAATPLGMARATNLETKVPVICVDVGTDACKDEFISTFKSLEDRSIEEGLIVSKSAIHRPLFERVRRCEVNLFIFILTQ